MTMVPAQLRQRCGWNGHAGPRRGIAQGASSKVPEPRRYGGRHSARFVRERVARSTLCGAPQERSVLDVPRTISRRLQRSSLTLSGEAGVAKASLHGLSRASDEERKSRVATPRGQNGQEPPAREKSHHAAIHNAQ